MKKRNWILVSIFLVAILLDQVSKIWVANQMQLLESIPVIEGFFNITYAHNTGAAWSMFEGKMVFFYCVTIVAVIGMCLYLKTLTEDYKAISRVGVVLMLAGTIGNFIDRLAFQYVRDFLDFIILGYDFPIFNVADMCLCIGIGLVILDEVMIEFGVGKQWKKKELE